MKKKVAILLSRQSMRPCGRTPWIQQTSKAIQWIKSHNYTLVSSLGVPTWDCVTAIASLNNIHQEILLPAIDTDSFHTTCQNILHDFNLDKNITVIKPSLIDTAIETSEIMKRRDAAVINDADILLPISVRPNGIMHHELHTAEKNGKEIITDFTCKYDTRNTPMKYKIPLDSIHEAISTLDQKYIIHWTRTANKPWPDERKIDYWEAVVHSDSYPRTAFSTLKHILISGKIIASSRHMPGNIATVSFSSLSPIDVIPLMRWRARYHEMTFEPYGIGIEKDYALSLGVMPVNYYDPKAGEKPDLTDIWRWQSRGIKGNWTQEAEYRYLGDFHFLKIPLNKILAFCYTPAEASHMSEETGIRCLPIIDSNIA